MNSKLSRSGFEKLPISIWPAEAYSDEPVQGWIHRAAERNHAYSTGSFVASLGVSGKDWDYDEFLKIVRQLPISSYKDLEHNTPKRRGKNYEICGYNVPLRFISKSERRVCPQCLSDARYLRTWFHFVPLTTCPYHNVALISGLPNDPVDWHHTEIGWTQSGVKLGLEHAIPRTATKLDRYIIGALSGTGYSIASHLMGLSLDVVISASLCLGKLFSAEERLPSTSENVRTVCQRGFEPLNGGTEAITEFLRQAEWLQLGYDRDRFTLRCQSVPKMLLAVRDKNLRHLIADSFARARVRNELTTPSGRLSKYDGEDNLHNLTGAARRLGISTRSLRKLLQKLGIESSRCKITRAHRLTLQQIEVTKRFIENSLDVESAATLLGCKSCDIDSFVKHGILNSDFYKDGRSYYSRSNIQNFEKRLIATKITNNGTGIILDEVFAKQLGPPLAEVCSHILRGKKIVFVDYDPALPLFLGMKVARNTASSAPIYENQHHRARIRPCAQVRDATTFAEAAARLGTSSNGLKILVNLSLIKIEKDSRNRERICSNSIEHFLNQYVKASAYAPTLDCHPTSALKILRIKGVQPINDAKNAGPRFVNCNEVKRLTGLDCGSATTLMAWQALQKTVDEWLIAHAVPATTRVKGTPAIEVRATSGRWSFLIEQNQESGGYSLTSNFTSRRQPGRLKKVQEASIAPSDIWPGATVLGAAQGGFAIVDEDLPFGPNGSIEASLVDVVVARSHQLHRLF